MKQRENFKSRIGFLLVSAGCAIGLGNIWKFPYITGLYGGGAFVLLYLIFLVILGIPVLTMELSLGRGSGQTIVNAYKSLEKPGSRWHLHGWFCMAGCYLLMMFYVPVAGWMLNYFVKFLSGGFTGITQMVQAGESREAVAAAVGGVFGTMLTGSGKMTLYMAIVAVGSFVVCAMGLQSGVERISKWMMTGLLALILVLVVHSFTLENAGEGLKFYLIPDLHRAAEQGIGSVASAAMNQAFFTLSIGIGSMEIFGSYMSKDRTVLGESVRICILDTFVAICAGLIIFPGCYTYNVDSAAGPSLIFESLPTIFVNMKGGRLWGTLFFLFMCFAAFSTVIAVFENLVANLMDVFGWPRKKAVILNAAAMLLLCMPCILGYGPWKNAVLNVVIGGEKKALDIQGMEDFLVSNVLLPCGALIYTIFTVYHVGWGFDNLKKEADKGSGLKLPEWCRYPLVFVMPPLIIVILVQGLIEPLNVVFGIAAGILVAVLDIFEIRYLIRRKKNS